MHQTLIFLQQMEWVVSTIIPTLCTQRKKNLMRKEVG
jgi:hypothetical protein